jgi:hypothetical protein
MRTIDDRYKNDAEFHQLVDLLEAMIRCGQFTPSETREAAMLAQMHHEMSVGRKVYFSKDLMGEIEFRAGGRFVTERSMFNWRCPGCGEHECNDIVCPKEKSDEK